MDAYMKAKTLTEIVEDGLREKGKDWRDLSKTKHYTHSKKLLPKSKR